MDTNIRISKETKDKIKTIANNQGASFKVVIEKAINFYLKELFLNELNENYEKSENDQNDDLWDNTLMDGL